MNKQEDAIVSALLDMATIRIEELTRERDQLRAENEDLRKALGAVHTVEGL